MSELREKVAREITRVYGGDVYDKDEIAYNLPIADAAIALVRAVTLEEAADTAERHVGTWDEEQAAARRIAAAIRALGKPPTG